MLQLTWRLLTCIERHRAVVVAMLIAMAVAALAGAAPIVIAKGAAGIVFDADQGGEPSWPASSLLHFGNWWSDSFDHPGLDPRLPALGLIVLAVLAMGLVAGGATFASHYLSRYMAALVAKELRSRLMRRILIMPIGSFTKRKAGDLLSRFSTDVQIAHEGLHSFLVIMVLQPLILLVAVGAAFGLNWRLALAVIVVLPTFVVPLIIIGKKVRKHSGRSLRSLGEATEGVKQILAGLHVIKSFAAEETEAERYDAINESWLKKQRALVKAKSLSQGIVDLVYAVSLAVILGLGGYLVITKQWNLDSETFVAFLLALAAIYKPLKRIAKGYPQWQGSMAAVIRVFEILDAEVEPEDAANAQAIGPIQKGIVFENVSFTYDEMSPTGATAATTGVMPVLRNLSFTIPAGKTVALVGPSGSGKSTIADLLMRLRTPSSGRILVDGRPTEAIKVRSLLAQMAVIGQSPFVFNTSIRENITFGKADATQAEIDQAARAAQIHDVISALPNGYDSKVGERGAALSGGQLQRLTIARALLKNPSFLLLDEATSSLDSESERAIQSTLRELRSGRTTFVIAHRFSTIIDSDLILVIEAGRIVEQGRHEELLALDGTYSRLFRAAN